jgi:hypothetical protein
LPFFGEAEAEGLAGIIALSGVETVRMHNPVSNGKPFGPEFSRVTACNIGVL